MHKTASKLAAEGFVEIQHLKADSQEERDRRTEASRQPPRVRFEKTKEACAAAGRKKSASRFLHPLSVVTLTSLGISLAERIAASVRAPLATAADGLQFCSLDEESSQFNESFSSPSRSQGVPPRRSAEAFSQTQQPSASPTAARKPDGDCRQANARTPLDPEGESLFGVEDDEEVLVSSNSTSSAASSLSETEEASSPRRGGLSFSGKGPSEESPVDAALAVKFFSQPLLSRINWKTPSSSSRSAVAARDAVVAEESLSADSPFVPQSREASRPGSGSAAKGRSAREPSFLRGSLRRRVFSEEMAVKAREAAVEFLRRCREGPPSLVLQRDARERNSGAGVGAGQQHQSAFRQSLLERLLEENGVKTQSRTLPLGDFCWSFGEAGSPEEVLLPVLVERKTVADFEASILDGR